MKKIIGIILIVLSFFLGYVGITKFTNSGESVKIIGLEISAEDTQQKTASYIYIGLAAVSLIGGMGLILSGNKK